MLLAVSLVAVMSAGCGSSSSDSFVFTGQNQVNNPTTGSLAFNFQQATAQSVVPAGTTSLRFDLYLSSTAELGTLFETLTFPYADRIVIPDVPVQVKFVVVTALNRDGLPLNTRSGAVTIEPGEVTEVALGDPAIVLFGETSVSPDPVNLVLDPFASTTSDSEQVTMTGLLGGSTFLLPVNADSVTFAPANTAVANVSATGLVSANFNSTLFPNIPAGAGNNTTVTATYTFNGQSQVDTFQVNSFVFGVAPFGQPVIAQGGSYNQGYVPLFIGADGVQADATSTTYALQTPVTGVNVSSNGAITTTNATPVGPITVVATWVDNRVGGTGLTFTDTIVFNVVADN